MNTFFTKDDLGFGVTEITAPMGEKIYVVEGNIRALVIDTGMGIGSLKEFVSSFCSLPLVVVNTHAHPDHSGGNAEFKRVYLHWNDFSLYRKMVTYEYRLSDIRKIFGSSHRDYEEALLPFCDNIIPFTEGEIINLGGRIVSAYKIEGHTKGSLVFLDSVSGFLFAGDAVSICDTWLYLDYSTSLEAYYNSLIYFKSLNLPITKILTGHEPNIAPKELIDNKIKCIEQIVAGNITGVPVETFAGKGLRAEYKDNSIIYNPGRIKDD